MSESHPASLRGLKVLVVDDDPDFCDSVTEAFVLEGAEAVGVVTSAGALDALSSFAADVLIIDLLLGQDDGIDLLERIRARDGARPVPAIALTAGRPSWLIGRDHAGFASLVHKPVDLGDLLELVASLTEARRASIERAASRAVTSVATRVA